MAIGDYIIHPGLEESIAYVVAAFSELFNGNLTGFLENGILSLPMFGVFYVLYILITFIGRISLFKDQEHQKYASYLGYGLAMIGFVNVQVFGLIYSVLGGSLVVLLLVIFIITFLVVGWNYSRRRRLESGTDAATAKTANLERKRALNEEKREYKIQKKVHARDREKINDIEDVMDINHFLPRSSLGIINTMLAQLARIGSLNADSESSRSNKAKLEQGMIKNLDILTRKINEEYLNTEKLERKVVDLKKLDVYALNLDKMERDHIYKDLEKTIRDRLANVMEVDKRKNQWKEDAKQKFEGLFGHMEKIVADVISMDQQRINLETQVDNFLQKEMGEFRTTITELKTQLSAALHSGDIPAATNILHKMKSEFQAIDAADNNMKKIISDIKRFEKDKKETEDLLDDIFNSIDGRLEWKYIGEGKYRRAGRKAANWTNKVMGKTGRTIKDIAMSGVKEDISEAKQDTKKERKAGSKNKPDNPKVFRE